MIHHRHNLHSRGVAMILVMIAMAVAGILVLAMLSSGAVHAQVGATSAVRVQAQYLAESGLNLATYYLKNPSASPVPLVYGANGNVHYPGETGITISGLPGTIDLTITNPANGQFQIASTGTFENTAVTAAATLEISKAKQFTYAGYFSGNAALNSKTTVSGGIITNGTLQQTSVGQVQGSSTTSSSGSSADLSGTNFTYPVSMFHYLPTYYYKGKSYQAKVLASNFTGGILSDSSATNPCNVWYIASSTIAMSGTTVLNGSLVTASGIGLKVSGTLTIKPTTNLPALVVSKDLTYSSSLTYVTANGPTYIGGELKGTSTGTSTLCGFSVNGIWIGAEGAYPVNSTYHGTVALNWVKTQAKTVAFADEMETVQSVTPQIWDTDNSRPQ